jgi:hypothetical protein
MLCYSKGLRNSVKSARPVKLCTGNCDRIPVWEEPVSATPQDSSDSRERPHHDRQGGSVREIGDSASENVISKVNYEQAAV